MSLRSDQQCVFELIPAGALVLDLGCGDGDLLSALARQKNVRGQGIEIDEQAIYQCVAKGVNVFHGDIDSGLAEYPDKFFDYVVLNQSMQQIRHADTVLIDALRVGKKVIVGFPNFAHYRARLQIFFGGKTPVTGALPRQWYETANLHFLSITDFYDYCRVKNITVEKTVFISGTIRISLFPNLFAQDGIFVISKV